MRTVFLRRSGVLVSALSIMLATDLHGVPQSTGNKSTGDRDVLTRSLVIGRSPRVQALMKQNPQGYRFRRGLSGLRVEERQVPDSCGIQIGNYFRTQLVSKNAPPTNDCEITGSTVTCRSAALPGYTGVYVALSYSHGASDLDLRFEVRQQGFWGEIRDPKLTDRDVDWFEDVFDCLVSLTECSSELPSCARRM